MLAEHAKDSCVDVDSNGHTADQGNCTHKQHYIVRLRGVPAHHVRSSLQSDLEETTLRENTAAKEVIIMLPSKVKCGMPLT